MALLHVVHIAQSVSSELYEEDTCIKQTFIVYLVLSWINEQNIQAIWEYVLFHEEQAISVLFRGHTGQGLCLCN